MPISLDSLKSFWEPILSTKSLPSKVWNPNESRFINLEFLIMNLVDTELD